MHFFLSQFSRPLPTGWAYLFSFAARGVFFFSRLFGFSALLETETPGDIKCVFKQFFLRLSWGPLGERRKKNPRGIVACLNPEMILLFGFPQLSRKCFY